MLREPFARVGPLLTAAFGAILAALAIVGAWGSDATPGDAGFVFQITVTTTVDEDVANSFCSLREAIVTANTNMNYKGCGIGALGDDTHIVFDIGAGTPVINISSSLPPITDDAIINGNTGGATRVQLLGDGGFFDIGLEVRADNSVINRMAIGGFGSNGIYVNNADNTIITGNFLGTDPTGTIAVPNGNGIGDGGTNTMIGGTNGWTPGGSCTGDCNLISGNQYGVVIGAVNSSPTTIQGNMIGTDVTGTVAIGNEIGFNIQGPYHLGGPSPGSGNLVSGNDQCGVETLGTTGEIEGNYVGVDTTGMASLPNASAGRFPVSCGIWINGDDVGAIVGGTSSGSRNVVADANAIQVSSSNNVTILGNYIGTGADGETPLGPETGFAGVNVDASIGAHIGGTEAGAANVITNHNNGVFIGSGNGDAYNNSIRGNSIYGNDSEGIALVDDDGPQPNQPVNFGIQPPVITGLGSVHGRACPNCTIDIYSDEEEEGRVYEGTTTAGGNGDWTFNGTVTGPFVTATATDPNKGTSEFSAPFSLATPTPTPSPSPSPTPTPTATPTATATPTPTPTPTASASPSGLTQGDVDCNDEVTSVDALKELRHVAELSVSQNEPCPDIGDDAASFWGDVDCNGQVTSVDALKILRHVAELSVSQTEPCPDIGMPEGG